MPFQIIRNDITKMHADAIVNTANPRPIVGSGTDFAIYKAAGWTKLLAERQKIGRIERGQAAITPAFKLNAKYIIHTVGPHWKGGQENEPALLRSCYENSLRLAKEYGCESIAFPMISTGNYGFPKDVALQIVLSVITKFLADEDMQIYLVVFDDHSTRLSEKLFEKIEARIDDSYAKEMAEREYFDSFRRRRRTEAREELLSSISSSLPDMHSLPEVPPLPDILPTVGSPFSSFDEDTTAPFPSSEMESIFEEADFDENCESEEDFSEAVDELADDGDYDIELPDDGDYDIELADDGDYDIELPDDWESDLELPDDGDLSDTLENVCASGRYDGETLLSEADESFDETTGYFGGYPDSSDDSEGDSPDDLSSVFAKFGYSVNKKKASNPAPVSTPDLMSKPTAKPAPNLMSKPTAKPEPAHLSSPAKAPQKKASPKDFQANSAFIARLLNQQHETFHQMLFRLIDERGISGPVLYKKANINKKLYSKIKNNPDYQPGKKTIFALALALELNLDQAIDLLSRAGYAFSPTSSLDRIVRCCFEEKFYNLYAIECLLYDLLEDTLTA